MKLNSCVFPTQSAMFDAKNDYELLLFYNNIFQLLIIMNHFFLVFNGL